MIYQVGDKIKSKKNHACGGNTWSIIRTGADIKLKCDNCSRIIFLSQDDVHKMTAEFFAKGDKNNEK